MELSIFLAGVLVACALGYLGSQFKNANRIAVIRLEFDRWNAPWSEERKKEFDEHISKVLKEIK